MQQLFKAFFQTAGQDGGDDVTVRIGEIDDGFFLEANYSGQPTDRRNDLAETVRGVIETDRWTVQVSENDPDNVRVEITGI